MRVILARITALMLCVNLEAENFHELSNTSSQKILTKGDHKRGPRGHRGKRGHRGHHGKRGHRGKIGSQGPTGPAGLAGPTGANGSTGATGPAGLAGPMGATGSTGATGALSSAYISSYEGQDVSLFNGFLTPIDFQLDITGTPVGGITHPTASDFSLPEGSYLVAWNLAATAKNDNNSISLQLFSNLHGLLPPTPNESAFLPIDQPVDQTVPISAQTIVIVPAGGDTFQLQAAIGNPGGDPFNPNRVVLSSQVINFVKIAN